MRESGEVASILKKIAKKTPAFALTQLVSAAKSDTFGKIKGLIESMIDRLEKEAAEEADAKAFCDTETEKSKAKQADLTAKLDMHAVRIEKARATIDDDSSMKKPENRGAPIKLWLKVNCDRAR